MSRLTEKDKQNIIDLLSYSIRFALPSEPSANDIKKYIACLRSAKKLHQNFGYTTNTIDRELQSLGQQ